MENIDEKVVTSYVENKLSEKQISEALSMSSHRVRNILNKNSIPRRSQSEASRQYHITKFGQKEFVLKTDLSKEDELLKVAGVMLYWGEGTKERGTVALANSDPKMIKVFMNFLRSICGIDENRLHVTLHYYEDQDPEELTTFWSLVMRIPKNQFYKPFLHKKSAIGTYKNLSKYGTVQLQYSDRKLFDQIKLWMEEYANGFSFTQL